jgi:hypothetical protein
VNEQIDLPSASQIGLESVPLRRVTFQSGALPAMHSVADFHAAIVKYFGIDDLVADLKLGVAITNLHLQNFRKSSRRPRPRRLESAGSPSH